MDIRELSRAIRSALNGDLKNAELSASYWLSGYATPAERTKVFLEELATLVKGRIDDLHRANGSLKLSALRNVDREQLIWRILYLHYFSRPTVKTRDIAKISQIPLKRIREANREGLRRLLDYVHRLEQAARKCAAEGQMVALCEYFSIIPPTTALQHAARQIEAHLEEKRLFVISGAHGMAAESLAAYFYTLVKNSRPCVFVNAQSELLDQHGRMHTLSYVARSAAEIICQIYEGLGMSGHTTTESQLRALEARQDRCVVIINRPDLLPQDELCSLARHISHLTHVRIILTTQCDLPMPHAQVLKLPELDKAQSKCTVEQARREANPNGCGALSDAAFERLYCLTGGNPLALVMLGTYLASHSTEQAETALKTAQPPFDALYRHVFGTAWQRLSECGRELLCYLASAPNKPISEPWLARRDLGKQVSRAIDEVRMHNLITITPCDETRYVTLLPLLHTTLCSKIFAC